MKKNLSFLMILFSLVIFGKDLPVAYLAEPSKVTSREITNALKSSIVYGALPPNYNGKVLVFMHGLTATASTMLEGNTFYRDSYNAGYRSAYVTATKISGDWKNGEILAQAIDQIVKEFSVNTVTIIAHSNGGKATEVAMFEYNKRDKVDKVITLGTPFKGTYLANIAQNRLISGIVRLIYGSSEGVRLSTTYYCRDQFRPYFDKHSLNQPQKFLTVGAWGYNNRKTNFSLMYAITGGVLRLHGDRVNDGVTPYDSSNRPGSKQLLAVNDSRGGYNHSDVAKSQYLWKSVIFPALQSEIEDSNMAKKSTLVEEEPYTEMSNHQILFSNNPNDYAWLASRQQKVQIDVISEKGSVDLNVKNIEGRTLRNLSYSTLNKVNKDSGKADQDNPFLALAEYIHSFELSDSESFKLESNSPYVAFVHDVEDSPMVYQVNKLGDKTLLEVSFPKLNLKQQESLLLKGTYAYIGDLKGEGDRGSDQLVYFKREGDKYIADVSNNPSGIYTLTLQAEIANQYKRGLISGFVLHSDSNSNKNKLVSPITELKGSEVSLVGNPLRSTSFLRLGSEITGIVSIKVYGVSGYLVREFNLQASSSLLIGDHLSNLSKGSYILNIKTNKGDFNVNFVK